MKFATKLSLSDYSISLRQSAVVAMLIAGMLGILVYALSLTETSLIEERRTKTQQLVEATISIVQQYQDDVDTGLITLEEAKKAAKHDIAAVRYDGNQYFWINDLDGIMLVHPSESLVGKSLLSIKDFHGKLIFTDLIELVKTKGGGFYEYWWKTAGEEEARQKMSYVQGHAEWGWVIGTGSYVDDVNVTYYAIAKKLLLVSGALAVLSTLFAYMISRSVTKPLKTIVRRMDVISHGDLSVDVPYTQNKDEIGHLAQALAIFKDNALALEQAKVEQERIEAEAAAAHQAEMQRVANNFEASVMRVVESILQSSSTMATTAQSMTNIAERTGSQAKLVANISEQAGDNVQTVATAAEELSASINEIMQQVAKSTEVNARATMLTEETTEQVRRLTEAAVRIDHVVHLIQDIAEQTNLLSLNATIEAARAGEAGKGFAVVANEVKTLANQTANATGGIAQQVQEMQEVASSTADAIVRISSVISEVHEISSSVASAIEEQAAATCEIARNVQEAAQRTDQVSESIGEVAHATDESDKAAHDVLEMSDGFRGEAGHLREEVVKFLQSVRAA